MMDGMRIRLDRSSSVPLSVQLREAVAARVSSGRLAPGVRVPTVREMAARLDLAPNTVAKAYRELESAGYLVGRGRRGTFVADVLPATREDAAAGLEEAAHAFAMRARQLGIPPRRAAAAARRAVGDLGAP
jgi:DNA-binding transcriptional regulator YhcF (GntR family)